MTLPELIYTDGGVIGPNPSPYGLSWCFVQVSNNRITHQRSGVIEPADLGVVRVSNNDSECLAVIRALESVPFDWNGILWTDSKVAMQRLINPKLIDKLPSYLQGRIKSLQQRKLQIKLVAGHPTEEELRLGYAKRNGFPVSMFNVACDRECTRLAKLYREDYL